MKTSARRLPKTSRTPAWRRVLGWGLGLAVLSGGAWLSFVLIASLPQENGEPALPGLSAPVAVDADALGIPSVVAENREDALRALGFLHARDRLFQMDLMRRKGTGRLAEWFGPDALELDRAQRHYRFEAAARGILAVMPETQRRALDAYVAGVNAYLAQAASLPPEYLVLGAQAEPWRAEDSLLALLGMFQTLNGDEQDERMVSVMERALPKELLEFLTPDTDRYAVALTGGPDSRRPPRPVPVEAWRALPKTRLAQGGVDAEPVALGSNNWAVSARKTADGRAIVADDMHLSLRVPNIWHRVSLRYRGKALDGIALPGVPSLAVGGNGHIAWGFTNVGADVLDLVALEIEPDDPQRYLTPAGWRRFERETQTIRVKNAPDETLTVESTIWGPVSPVPLLGQRVAVRWTALDAAAVDIGLIEMDGAETLEQAMAIMNRFGGPPQNVALADDRGRIAWTLLGRLPRRTGMDGSVSRSWAKGDIGWDGFVPPEELPRSLDPPEGFLVTANNRTIGKEYPHIVGHNWALGYRAYRIAERLRALENVTEREMLAVQLDTRSEVFEYYRTLALSVADEAASGEPALARAVKAIRAWDGRMEADSKGIALLTRFRQNLADIVFAGVVARCRALDPGFRYNWREMETPLRALLDERDPATLPDARYADWRAPILEALRAAALELERQYADIPLDRLNWGTVNRVDIRHPFARGLPWLSALLDMPAFEGAGCNGFCVRVINDKHGATERMALSPNHPEDGILHMPGGQSGHPLSRHYRDQQDAWRDGAALPLLPGSPRARLRFAPAAAP